MLNEDNFMGKWVIFIGDEKFTPETIKGMTFEGNTGTRDYGEKQFDVLYNEDYVSFQFDYDGMLTADYPPEFVKSLPFDSPRFILAKYSKQSFLERVISSKDFPKDVLIDCDGVELGLERLVDESRLVHWDEDEYLNHIIISL